MQIAGRAAKAVKRPCRMRSECADAPQSAASGAVRAAPDALVEVLVAEALASCESRSAVTETMAGKPLPSLRILVSS